MSPFRDTTKIHNIPKLAYLLTHKPLKKFKLLNFFCNLNCRFLTYQKKKKIANCTVNHICN